MPFIRTALLGSEGSPVLAEGEYVMHCGIIRFRVRGSGILRPTMYSMDDLTTETVNPITMADPVQYIQERKCNFRSQRMSLELTTTAIDEIAYVNKIIFFVRPLWASLPSAIAG